ncbi:MAG: LEA type 2 family protein [Deltaproteobacteria bacterium]|nr:LEA type 2 family protein [Deltaproteobacteria bacterium]
MKRFQRTRCLSLLIATGITLTLLAGCAGFGKRLEAPEVSLAHITIQESKGFETTYQIDLRVFNTNEIPLEVKGVDCELEINGRKFAKGVSPTETTVPAYGTELLQVEVYSSMLEMVSSFLNMVREVQSKQAPPNIEYKITGRLRLGSGKMLPGSFPFKYEGELNLQEITSGKTSP